LSLGLLQPLTSRFYVPARFGRVRLWEECAMKRHTGTFTAQDKTGKIHTVHEYTDFIDAGTLDDPSATIPGLKQLRTSDGQVLNYKQKGVYEIVATGIILKSNDPKAP
jgi:hypothetical protein